MNVSDNKSFPQKIVAAIPALLKENPQDCFALVGLEEDANASSQIPGFTGFSWAEHADESLDTAAARLTAIFNEIARTSTKKLAVVTISDNEETRPVAQLAGLIASLTGVEIVADLRVTKIEAGAPITGLVHGHDVSVTQIDPTEF